MFYKKSQAPVKLSHSVVLKTKQVQLRTSFFGEETRGVTLCKVSLMMDCPEVWSLLRMVLMPSGSKSDRVQFVGSVKIDRPRFKELQVECTEWVV